MFALYERGAAVSAGYVRTNALAVLFVLCEHTVMETPLRTSELAATVGISKSYASEILSEKREPSRPLAIAIFQRTGRKFGPVAHLSDEDIATLARIESTSTRAA